MKWVYLVAGLAFYLKMLILPDPVAVTEFSVLDLVVQDSGVPNAVSGILFHNRLYDTIFEVVVFTIAIMGVRFLLADEQPSPVVYQFTDAPSIVLARLGATIAALVSIELAIRGHLSPGGGFAAGVAGGTAIGLVAITSSSHLMESVYQRWHAATGEKVAVLIFIGLSILTLAIGSQPTSQWASQLAPLLGSGWIPLLNILVAIKVALGSWAAILIFIRYRGLL